MFFRPWQQKICYILLICTLFFGMCSTSVDGHPLFVLKSSNASVASFTEPAIRALRSDMSLKQAPSQKGIGTQEAIVSTTQVIRRIPFRIYRNISATIPALFCILWMPFQLIVRIRSFNSLSSVAGIIIRYIHQQDGDKHRLLPI